MTTVKKHTKNVKIINYSNSVGESVLARFLTGLLCPVPVSCLAHTQRFLCALTPNLMDGVSWSKGILKGRL